MRGLATFVQEAMEIKRVWNLAYPKGKSNLNVDAFALFVQIAVDKGSSQLTAITRQAGFNDLLGLRLIDGILEKGMHVVKKTTDPFDKRASRVELTEKGQTLYKLLVNGAEMLPREYAACVQEVTKNG
jgi:DNA-binding MarR family transcriptional regulator